MAEALRGAVARNRVGHGYLLTGPRGVGKTSAARILAMALNCERRDPAGDGEPCGECESCRRVWTGSASLDVVEIDAASNRGVDDARDLRERAMYAASQAGHHKVYIVDEAHMLTREAWNALLKILEEPPPGVVFVFATTEPQKIASTAAPVMSRLQRFDFRRIGPVAIRDRLRAVLDAEGLTADDDALLLIGRTADGGMRDALSILDQCLSFGEGPITAERVRQLLGLIDEDVFADVLRSVADKDPARVFPIVDQLMEAGADLGDFMTGLGETIRAVLMAGYDAEPPGLTERMRQVITEFRVALPAEDLVRMLRLLAESETAIRRSASPRLVVETLLLRWTLMDRTVDLAEVLRAGTPEEGAEPAAPPAAPRRAARPARESSAAPTASGSSLPEPRPRAPTPPPRDSSAPPESTADLPAAEAPPAVPVRQVPFALEAIRAEWAGIAAAVKAESKFLGEAVSKARPTVAAAPVLTLSFAPVDTLHWEKVEREASQVESVLTRILGGPVRLVVEMGVPEGGAPQKAKRLSSAEIRSERLGSLRATDPALDTAADELDLEIVDESP